MLTITRRTNGTRRVQIRTSGKSKTEQSHRKAVNINTIVAKAFKTGLFPTRTDRPTYGDFTGAVDFHEATSRIKNANDQFMMLPSEIRNRFENDPGKLLVFLAEPDNRSEAIEMGLIPRPVNTEKETPPAAQEPEKVLQNETETKVEVETTS